VLHLLLWAGVAVIVIILINATIATYTEKSACDVLNPSQLF
jgi:hypothetical protein